MSYVTRNVPSLSFCGLSIPLVKMLSGLIHIVGGIKLPVSEDWVSPLHTGHTAVHPSINRDLSCFRCNLHLQVCSSRVLRVVSRSLHIKHLFNHQMFNHLHHQIHVQLLNTAGNATLHKAAKQQVIAHRDQRCANWVMSNSRKIPVFEKRAEFLSLFSFLKRVITKLLVS